MESGTVDEIKAKTEALAQASHKLAEEVYKSSQGQQQAGGETSAGAADNGTSGSEGKPKADDADFEVIN